MAVSEWSDVASQNLTLGSIPLNGSFGMVIAELMAQIKAALDGNDTRVGALEDAVGEWTGDERTTAVKAAIEAVEAEIGAWTDTTETTAVKAAIEALRPAGE